MPEEAFCGCRNVDFISFLCIMKFYSFDTFLNILSSESVKNSIGPDLAPGPGVLTPDLQYVPPPSRGRRARLMFDEPGRDGRKVHQPGWHFSQPSPLPGNVRNLFLMQNVFLMCQGKKSFLKYKSNLSLQGRPIPSLLPLTF